ncbi:hypothetical protein [Myroides indicus]|uniref:Uncharacterized protein n=1 Tax=Myroides indicus TaxID=1323422 RepID=A0A4R7F112_9FLAO|nr:hypothetical protein [Myroides indicus]TDS62117.1 hypothetical protein C8P70_10787 [Myroides indicus]
METKYNLYKATEQEQKQADKIFKKVEQHKGDIKSQIASVIRHLSKYYQYTNLEAYNALPSFFNITAKEIKSEINGKFVHGLAYFALNGKGKKISNLFKALLFGKDAGIVQLQKHFEQSKEKMQTNPARSVLKNIDNGSRTVCNGLQLGKNLSAKVFNNWWNNGNKPELKIQNSSVSNTNIIDN